MEPDGSLVCFLMRYFRKNYVFCFLVALLQWPAVAADVALAWMPDPDPMVAGYNLYFGGISGSYTNKIFAGNATNVIVSGLIPGTTYYFAASACGTNGSESSLSSEVSCRVAPIVPAINRPPTLNAISNLAVSRNAGLQTVHLTGITSGATNENQTLTVTAVSSNTRLIPRPTLDYTSPGAAGSLTFRPATNKIGKAVITVTVKDNGTRNNIVIRKFAVTVTNDSRPVFTCSLTNQAALPGQTRTLAVKATGNGTLRYQWKFNGVVLASVVSPTLTLNHITTNQSGVYSVTVTDRNGSTNSIARLTVYATAAGTLASAGLANGCYTLAVQNVSGCRYIVQATTDFVNWVPVRTNTAPFIFEDTTAGRFNQRFYRAVYAP
jgi:hypothetical protein